MEKVTLKDIVTVRSGYPFRQRPERADSGGCALVQMRDLDGSTGSVRGPLEQVSPPENWREHRLQPGDVLFAPRGPRNDAAEFIDDIEAVPASHLLVLRLRTTTRVLPAYLVWYLNRRETQGYLNSLRVGTSIAFIPTEAVRELKVPLPDQRTQHHIVNLHRLACEESGLMTAIQAKRQEMVTGVFQTLLAKETTT